MATLNFSSLVNGSTLSFDPMNDNLNFDDTGISAASLTLSYAGNYGKISLSAAGKTVYLPAKIKLTDLTTANISFADGSQLIFGDNTVNTLNGGDGDDYLLGLAGNDALTGRTGDDVLDGGKGADTMTGGSGSDTYIVDNVHDVVVEQAEIQLISSNSDGVQGNAGSDGANFATDGSLIVFMSYASNLVSGDTNGVMDIFVKNLKTSEIQRISTDNNGLQSNNESYVANISADGRYIVFTSYADNLVADDTNGVHDIFIKDLQTQAIQRVSTSSNGEQGDMGSWFAEFSADVRYVLFESSASNFIANPTGPSYGYDLYVKDLLTGAIQCVSSDVNGLSGNNMSGSGQFSPDNSLVAFNSSANNLVPLDTNNRLDIFIKNLQTGAIQLASSSANGEQGNGDSNILQFSADGNFILFMSSASNLVADDTNNLADIFLKDLRTNSIQRLSTAANGAQANADCYGGELTADARYLLFYSLASNLVEGDTNPGYDVFVKDLRTGVTKLVSTNEARNPGNGNSTSAHFSADGHYIVFDSIASNLVSNDSNGSTLDIFRVANPFSDGSTDTIQSSVSYTLPDGIENIVLTGSANINATGNELDNQLTGNKGKNILDGGLGADRMIGGLGNDTYIVDNACDLVSEDSNAGTDLVKVNSTEVGGSYTLTANVENAQLINNVAFNLTGNSLANTLKGNAAANVLDGGDGIDTLIGGAGDDTYVVDLKISGLPQDFILDTSGSDSLVLRGTSNNTINVTWTLSTAENIDASATGNSKLYFGGNAANNIMIGNNARNLMQGYAGDDTLSGGGGDDILAGGSGNDILTGGEGNDEFVFVAPLSATNIDTINDFDTVSEYIYLAKNIFSKFKHPGKPTAGNVVAGDQVQAQDADDYLLFDTATGALYYDPDGNGSKAAMQFATLVGVDSPLSATNFFII